ncbi:MULTISPECIES: DUF3139 domain-containing protein [Staphylococcus]|uniref:DUF3139 domain-containing protein n=1 Tax=Staphylococcus agnetis TaxID=985762 RepID=A0A242VJ02_9STAP|nr:MULTISPECIES: DUF3139 domain-containing protein [Staphylococcus]ALN77225.1 DUF3139 domain-containing protein [Staphylococcus agnetis]MBY7663369.1 DUF3139 domain-containing protein [Staphylococcus agnetis]MCO4325930.1 DUF3139 domain-containing protein [Staphylococcus agnetis]MCO4338032.1 DUF3139 domain-containing protein [Staphylococcus agnetis]MCO4340323.1 DUF3139 domain-containing protein [Staphylococcus agnetis]
MAKKILGFVFIAVLLFVLVAAGFFAYKGYQKSQNYKLIDQYLTEKHLKSKIIDEKSDYDQRKGIFYKEIRLKGDEKNIYIAQPIHLKRGLFLQGFDAKTKKHDKKAKYNFFDENYKMK